MKRIVFLTHYAELYGANLSMVNLIEGLQAYGIQSHVICPLQGDLLRALASRGVPVAELPFEWWVSGERTLGGGVWRLGQNVKHLRPIIVQLKRWRVDLVYSNSSVFAMGAMAALRLGLPHVWHLREFGNRDYDLWLDWGSSISRRIFNSANATIFVSHALKDAFLGNTNPPNSHVIYNGVAAAAVYEERRARSQQLWSRDQPLTFVLVGRFRESKGQAVAIHAFARLAKEHPYTRLLLVGGAGGTGDQSYFEGCREIVRTMNLTQQVEFWGYIPDPEQAFLAADVALMCSQNEAMGRVTVEAMSACRPVIGFASGGTKELIQHERTGLLYQGDAEQLCHAMRRYVEQPDLARTHGEAGWQYARREHTTEIYASRIHQVVQTVFERVAQKSSRR